MNDSIFPSAVDVGPGTIAGTINNAWLDLDRRVKDTQYMIDFLIQKGLIDEEELLDFLASRRLAERMNTNG